MPAMTKCSTCGFEGNHGFTSCVGGITKFYHTIDETKLDCMENSCQFYEYDGKRYKTLADAWKLARESFPNDLWRQAFDALYLENKPRKHRRIIDKWREEALK